MSKLSKIVGLFLLLISGANQMHSAAAPALRPDLRSSGEVGSLSEVGAAAAATKRVEVSGDSKLSAEFEGFDQDQEKVVWLELLKSGQKIKIPIATAKLSNLWNAMIDGDTEELFISEQHLGVLTLAELLDALTLFGYEAKNKNEKKEKLRHYFMSIKKNDPVTFSKKLISLYQAASYLDIKELPTMIIDILKTRNDIIFGSPEARAQLKLLPIFAQKMIAPTMLNSDQSAWKSLSSIVHKKAPVTSIVCQHHGPVTAARWSANSATITSGSHLLGFRGLVDVTRQWQASDGTLISQTGEPFNGDESPTVTAPSPDESYLALRADKTKIAILNDDQRLTTLSGHTDFINQIVWAPNGKFLATCSHDYTVRIWDFSNFFKTQKEFTHLEIDQAELFIKLANRAKFTLTDEERAIFGRMPAQLCAAIAPPLQRSTHRSKLSKSGLMAHIAHSSARPQTKKAGAL